MVQCGEDAFGDGMVGRKCGRRSKKATPIVKRSEV